MRPQITAAEILQILEEVKDPEIPVLSLIDLGVIREVACEGEQISITITPTFVGCPALEMMKSEIIQTLERNGIFDVKVSVSFAEPWSSDNISEKGRIALKSFGLAPPPPSNLITDLEILENIQCPRCNGSNTEMKTLFGPTLCRSIHYCWDCRESFEQFKPL
jgi:ring-1,2-phenylacetyl-CoA epoxidase subunit PaaD